MILKINRKIRTHDQIGKVKEILDARIFQKKKQMYYRSKQIRLKDTKEEKLKLE
jgi:hypothetical protein